MRLHLKTSLIAIVCAAAVTDVHAAASVRSLGAAGGSKSVYSSAGAATTSTIGGRAGSLRTGSFARPGAGATKISTQGTPVETSADGSANSVTGSVTVGGTTTNRVASTPRLAIGKYIGSAKSISGGGSSGGGTSSEVLQRLDRVEDDISNLETNKQNKLSGSTYIEVTANDTLDLNYEDLKAQVASDLDVSTKLDKKPSGSHGGELMSVDSVSGEIVPSGVKVVSSVTQDGTDVVTSGAVFGAIKTVTDNISETIAPDLANKLDKKPSGSHGGELLSVDSVSGEIVPSGVKVISAVTDGATDVVTSGAVYTAIENAQSSAASAAQAKSTSGQRYNVADGNGGWVALNSNATFSGEGYDASNGATAGAIKTYADTKLATHQGEAGQVLRVNASGDLAPESVGSVAEDNTGLVTGGAVYAAIDAAQSSAASAAQAKSTSGQRYNVADGNGGWVALNSNATFSGEGYDASNGATAGAIKTYADTKLATHQGEAGQVLRVNASGDLAPESVGSVAEDNTGLVTGGAVYAAIDAAQSSAASAAQAKSTSGQRYNVADGNGGWVALNSNATFSGEGYDASNGATAGAIKTYADTKLATHQGEAGQVLRVNASGDLAPESVGSVAEDNTGLVTGGAVYAAIDAAQSGIATDFMAKDTSETKDTYKVMKNNTWQSIGDAVEGTTDVVTVTPGVDGKLTINVVKNGAVASGDNKLVTGATVYATTNALDTNKQDKAIATSTEANQLLAVGSDGQIAVSGKTVVDTIANGNMNPVTSNAVYGAITDATGGVLPPRTGDCAPNSGTDCALVTTSEGLAWVPIVKGNE